MRQRTLAPTPWARARKYSYSALDASLTAMTIETRSVGIVLGNLRVGRAPCQPPAFLAFPCRSSSLAAAPALKLAVRAEHCVACGAGHDDAALSATQRAHVIRHQTAARGRRIEQVPCGPTEFGEATWARFDGPGNERGAL